jgi:hypothetical protein
LPPALIVKAEPGGNMGIAGLPTKAGTYYVKLIVTDSGAPAQQVGANYTIVITTPAPSPSPTST